MAIIDGDHNPTKNDILNGTPENDIIHGLTGADLIQGNGGTHDELFGDDGDDFIDTSNGGNHLLDGGSGNDQLFGSDGLDTLIGGIGDDFMQGGGGNDSYNVDSSADTIFEVANGGSDTVLSSISFTLPNTLENLTLLGTANLSGLGNSGNNIILGNDGNNLLGDDNFNDGTDSGDDFIDGGGGFDTLVAKADANFILTNTTLEVIGNSKTTFGNIETVTIAGGSGVNALDASQFTLGKVSLFGGDGDDTLRGGSGNDFLFSGSDNDHLTGGAGSDTFDGGDDFDVLEEKGDFNLTINNGRIVGNGTDTFRNIERIEVTGGNANNTFNAATTSTLVTLNGGGGNDTLIGGTKGDTLSGGDGDDKFAGGGGTNTMTGDAGSDRFIINTGRPFEAITSGFSFITDFTSGSDKIVLDKTTFTSLQSPVGNGLTANDFAIVTSGSNRSTAVTESNARIIYHVPTGSLIYNENGSAAGVGAGGDFAGLKNSPKLTAADFVVQSGSTDGLTGIPVTQLANNVISFSGAAVGGIVKGNAHDNNIHTRGGDDTAMGGKGNDKIHGGSGNDIISGDQGKDTLFGDAGWDTFVLAPNAGVDIIRDYQHGVDHLGLKQLKFEQLHFEQRGSRSVILEGGRELAILNNVQANQLTSDDFINVKSDKVNGVRVPVAIWA
jgi:Ca2+-binding RTX toxin-like protein